MLKILVFYYKNKQTKNKKQYIGIIYHERKLSLFGSGHTRQAKTLIFTVFLQTEQLLKVKKRDVIRT